MKEAHSADRGRLDAGRLGHDAGPEASSTELDRRRRRAAAPVPGHRVRPLRRGRPAPRYRGSLVTGWETVVNVDGGLSIT